MNVVAMTGRLGNDPESFVYGDKQGAKFRLAVQDRKDTTFWFDVTVFEPSARFVLDYLRKGALVGIEGRLSSRTWEKQDGGKGYAVEIIAHRVDGLESRAEREAREGDATPKQQAKKPPMPRQSREEAAPDWATDEAEDPFGDQ